MLLSVVFSFRNEESNLKELVERVHRAIKLVDKVDYELIFVNDASTDSSLEILLSLKDKYKIKILNMSRNFGVTPCVLAGFEYSKGDAVIYMDSDLQDPPELIPEMLSRYFSGHDVVHTTRTKREGENLLKMWITKKAYDVINFFSDIELPRNTGDFKLLSRRVVDKILEIKEVDPYMRGISIWVGFKQDYVFYVREARFAGETHMPLFGRGPVREFLRGLTAFSAGPLYISFFIGIFSVLISFGLALYLLGLKVIGLAQPGVTMISLLVVFFGGLILMTNGIMGLYIARVYNESKGRPRYIISNVID